jgi:hypothetical protein
MTLINVTAADRRATAQLSAHTEPRRRSMGAQGAIREAVGPIQNALNDVAALASAAGSVDPEAARALAEVTDLRSRLEEALGRAGRLLSARAATVAEPPMPEVPGPRAEGCTCPSWRPCRNDDGYGTEA